MLKILSPYLVPQKRLDFAIDASHIRSPHKGHFLTRRHVFGFLTRFPVNRVVFEHELSLQLELRTLASGFCTNSSFLAEVELGVQLPRGLSCKH